MNAIRTLIAISLLVASMSGCSESSSAFRYLSIVDHAHIAVHSRTAPDAVVGADGSLRIRGRDVATTPSQQRQLSKYFTSVMALHDDAIATGKAGMETAGEVLGGLAAAMFSKNSGQLEGAIDAKAEQVDKSANRVCRDLSNVQATQARIASSLPAFRPYTLTGDSKVSNCAGS